MSTQRRKTTRGSPALLVVATLATAVGGTALGSPPAAAKPAPPPEAQPLAKQAIDRMLGDYRFAGGERERNARDAAIDDVVDEMNFIARGIARKRLRESNRIAERVSITRNQEQLTVRFDDRSYSAPINGGAVDVVGITGAKLKLRHRVSGGRIEQNFVGEDGGRTNQIELDGDGRLKIRVRVFSERLPKDLRYTLTYAR